MITKFKKHIVSFLLFTFFISLTNNFVYAVEVGGFGIANREHFDTTKILELNYNVGHVVDYYASDKQEKVIIIEDLHCDESAQRNIAKILSQIKQEHKGEFNTIGIEGSVGKIDVGILGFLKDKKVRARVIQEYISKGYISGAELYAINEFLRNKINLIGIEDEKLYETEVKLLYETMSNGRELVKKLSLIEKNLEEAAEFLYPEELKLFEKNIKNVNEGKEKLEIYIEKNLNLAKKYEIEIEKNYPSLVSYIKLQELDGKINYKLFSLEVENINKQLRQKNNKMKKDLNSEEIYFLYKNKDINFPTGAFPELQKYIKFRELNDAFDKIKFWEEEKNLKSEIRRILSQSRGKELSQISESLGEIEEMKAYLQNGISRKGSEAWRTARGRFYESMRNLGSLISYENEFVKNFADFEKLENKMDLFYQIAEKRDEIMLKKLLEAENTGRVKALIVGGYHSRGIAEYLRGKGIGYEIVRPSLKGNYDKEIYLNRLEEEYGRITGQEKRDLQDYGIMQDRLMLTSIFGTTGNNLKLMEDIIAAYFEVNGKRQEDGKILEFFNAYLIDLNQGAVVAEPSAKTWKLEKLGEEYSLVFGDTRKPIDLRMSDAGSTGVFKLIETIRGAIISFVEVSQALNPLELLTKRSGIVLSPGTQLAPTFVPAVEPKLPESLPLSVIRQFKILYSDKLQSSLQKQGLHLSIPQSITVELRRDGESTPRQGEIAVSGFFVSYSNARRALYIRDPSNKFGASDLNKCAVFAVLASYGVDKNRIGVIVDEYIDSLQKWYKEEVRIAKEMSKAKRELVERYYTFYEQNRTLNPIMEEIQKFFNLYERDIQESLQDWLGLFMYILGNSSKTLENNIEEAYDIILQIKAQFEKKEMYETEAYKKLKKIFDKLGFLRDCKGKKKEDRLKVVENQEQREIARLNRQVSWINVQSIPIISKTIIVSHKSAANSCGLKNNYGDTIGGNNCFFNVSFQWLQVMHSMGQLQFGQNPYGINLQLILDGMRDKQDQVSQEIIKLRVLLSHLYEDFSLGSQHDANESIRKILEITNTTILAKVVETSILQRNNEVSSPSTTQTLVDEVAIDISSDPKVLEAFTIGHALTEDNVEAIDVGIKTMSYRRLEREQSPPNTLQLQLKRFKYGDTGPIKITTSVNLDDSFKVDFQRDGVVIPATYRFKAVICHSGITANSGHYFTYVKENGRWFLYNDSSVTQVDSLPKEVSHQAYMLMYEKVPTAEAGSDIALKVQPNAVSMPQNFAQASGPSLFPMSQLPTAPSTKLAATTFGPIPTESGVMALVNPILLNTGLPDQDVKRQLDNLLKALKAPNISDSDRNIRLAELEKYLVSLKIDDARRVFFDDLDHDVRGLFMNYFIMGLPVMSKQTIMNQDRRDNIFKLFEIIFSLREESYKQELVSIFKKKEYKNKHMLYKLSQFLTLDIPNSRDLLMRGTFMYLLNDLMKGIYYEDVIFTANDEATLAILNLFVFFEKERNPNIFYQQLLRDFFVWRLKSLYTYSINLKKRLKDKKAIMTGVLNLRLAKVGGVNEDRLIRLQATIEALEKGYSVQDSKKFLNRTEMMKLLQTPVSEKSLQHIYVREQTAITSFLENVYTPKKSGMDIFTTLVEALEGSGAQINDQILDLLNQYFAKYKKGGVLKRTKKYKFTKASQEILNNLDREEQKKIIAYICQRYAQDKSPKVKERAVDYVANLGLEPKLLFFECMSQLGQDLDFILKYYNSEEDYIESPLQNKEFANAWLFYLEVLKKMDFNNSRIDELIKTIEAIDKLVRKEHLHKTALIQAYIELFGRFAKMSSKIILERSALTSERELARKMQDYVFGDFSYSENYIHSQLPIYSFLFSNFGIVEGGFASFQSADYKLRQKYLIRSATIPQIDMNLYNREAGGQPSRLDVIEALKRRHSELVGKSHKGSAHVVLDVLKYQIVKLTLLEQQRIGQPGAPRQSKLYRVIYGYMNQSGSSYDEERGKSYLIKKYESPEAMDMLKQELQHIPGMPPISQINVLWEEVTGTQLQLIEPGSPLNAPVKPLAAPIDEMAAAGYQYLQTPPITDEATLKKLLNDALDYNNFIYIINNVSPDLLVSAEMQDFLIHGVLKSIYKFFMNVSSSALVIDKNKFIIHYERTLGFLKILVKSGTIKDQGLLNLINKAEESMMFTSTDSFAFFQQILKIYQYIAGDESKFKFNDFLDKVKKFGDGLQLGTSFVSLAPISQQMLAFIGEEEIREDFDMDLEQVKSQIAAQKLLSERMMLTESSYMLYIKAFLDQISSHKKGQKKLKEELENEIYVNYLYGFVSLIARQTNDAYLILLLDSMNGADKEARDVILSKIIDRINDNIEKFKAQITILIEQGSGEMIEQAGYFGMIVGMKNIFEVREFSQDVALQKILEECRIEPIDTSFNVEGDIVLQSKLSSLSYVYDKKTGHLKYISIINSMPYMDEKNILTVVNFEATFFTKIGDEIGDGSKLWTELPNGFLGGENLLINEEMIEKYRKEIEIKKAEFKKAIVQLRDIVNKSESEGENEYVVKYLTFLTNLLEANVGLGGLEQVRVGIRFIERILQIAPQEIVPQAVAPEVEPIPETEFLRLAKKDKGVEGGYWGIKVDLNASEMISRKTSSGEIFPSVLEIEARRVFLVGLNIDKVILDRIIYLMYLDEQDKTKKDKIVAVYENYKKYKAELQTLGWLKRFWVGFWITFGFYKYLYEGEKNFLALLSKYNMDIFEMNLELASPGEALELKNLIKRVEIVQKIKNYKPKALERMNVFNFQNVCLVKTGDARLIAKLRKSQDEENFAKIKEFMAFGFARLIGAKTSDVRLSSNQDGSRVMLASGMVNGFSDFEGRLMSAESTEPVDPGRIQLRLTLDKGFCDDIRVAGLESTLMAFALLNDTDGVGAKGQNLGIDSEWNISVIDLGHSFKYSKRYMRNLGAFLIPSLIYARAISSVADPAMGEGRFMQFKNYSLFQEIPLREQMRNFRELLERLAIRKEDGKNEFEMFAEKLKIQYPNHESEIDNLLRGFLRRIHYIEALFGNRLELTDQELNILQKLQLLVLDSQDNPHLSVGVELLDTMSYFDVIQSSDSLEFVLYSNKNTGKYMKRLKKLLEANPELEITFTKKGFIIKRNKLGSFNSFLNSKKESFVVLDNKQEEGSEDFTRRQVTKDQQFQIDILRHLKDTFFEPEKLKSFKGKASRDEAKRYVDQLVIALYNAPVFSGIRFNAARNYYTSQNKEFMIEKLDKYTIDKIVRDLNRLNIDVVDFLVELERKIQGIESGSAVLVRTAALGTITAPRPVKMAVASFFGITNPALGVRRLAETLSPKEGKEFYKRLIKDMPEGCILKVSSLGDDLEFEVQEINGEISFIISREFYKTLKYVRVHFGEEAFQIAWKQMISLQIEKLEKFKELFVEYKRQGSSDKDARRLAMEKAHEFVLQKSGELTRKINEFMLDIQFLLKVNKDDFNMGEVKARFENMKRLAKELSGKDVGMEELVVKFKNITKLYVETIMLDNQPIIAQEVVVSLKDCNGKDIKSYLASMNLLEDGKIKPSFKIIFIDDIVNYEDAVALEAAAQTMLELEKSGKVKWVMSKNAVSLMRQNIDAQRRGSLQKLIDADIAKIAYRKMTGELLLGAGVLSDEVLDAIKIENNGVGEGVVEKILNTVFVFNLTLSVDLEVLKRFEIALGDGETWADREQRIISELPNFSDLVLAKGINVQDALKLVSLNRLIFGDKGLMKTTTNISGRYSWFRQKFASSLASDTKAKLVVSKQSADGRIVIETLEVRSKEEGEKISKETVVDVSLKTAPLVNREQLSLSLGAAGLAQIGNRVKIERLLTRVPGVAVGGNIIKKFKQSKTRQKTRSQDLIKAISASA